MKILFVATFTPIVADPKKSRTFYEKDIGIELEHTAGEYAYTAKLGGTKHFGLWPLHEAAEACFGSPEWPKDVPVPQATLELEVDDVAAAAKELESKGHKPIHPPRKEPWGQTIARFMTPEGLLLGLAYTPALRS